MTTLKNKDVDGIPVICEECGVAITKDSVGRAERVVETHNDARHSGNEVAAVVETEYEVDMSSLSRQQEQEFISKIYSILQ